MASIPSQERSLLSLFSDLWRETTTLVHEEAELAKAELSEKVSQVTTGAGEIAAGGAILFAGFIVLLFAAVGALQLMLPTEHSIWIAPLIVGLVVMIIGTIALRKGKKQMQAESLAPRRTIESLKRDARLAKEHVK
jgi:putative superfamily III holin-X